MNREKFVESISVGSKVMVRDDTRSSKWLPVYEGPFTVVRQNAGGAYILKDATADEIPRKFTIDKLKLFGQTGQMESKPVIEEKQEQVEAVKDQGIQDQDAKSYVLEKLIRHRTNEVEVVETEEQATGCRGC